MVKEIVYILASLASVVPSWAGLVIRKLLDLLGLDAFKDNIAKAKVTGVLLAKYINENIMKNASISLLGFSLGTQVIYSCLKELARLGRTVHNVYFLGGAVSIDSDWPICQKAVAGKIFNCYSTKDWVLKFLYQPIVRKKPVGINEIPDAINFNVTEEAGGHTQYKDHLVAVLDKINYNLY